MAQDTSLAVDIGGTFTDVVLRTRDGVHVEKTLTTPEDLLQGFFAGVEAVLRKAGAAPEDIGGMLVHATTVVTNALIERKGARTAMVFTEGFRDVLRIRDERRYDMYDPQIEFPSPLVAADDTFTLDERVLSDGRVEHSVSDAALDALARKLEEHDVKSVGICFLHSYKNSVNELYAAEGLKRRLPDLFVCTSSEVAPQIREYLRASTTSVNAYAVSITEPYLNRLSERLAAQNFPGKPLIMLSSGGVVGAKTAGRMPVRMIESGPAAGALGAAFVARAMGLKDLLAFDMGGTTAKVCLIQDGKPLVTGLFEVDRMYRFKEGSGLPVTVPCVDMIEIGAGGGSIAHVSELGLLRVGPRSAGARPGPACYGRGGDNATVTDADVLLGAIDPVNFLGGTMPLDADAAREAMSRIATGLSTSITGAARGIYQMVSETMAAAVRAHANDRGVDYRGIPLLAFGGAGPVHACEVARLLNSRTVIFPPLASVLSAFGALVTPVRLDLVRSILSPLEKINWRYVLDLIQGMEAEGRQSLLEAGCRADAVSFSYAADMRYAGQGHEITVSFDERPTEAAGAVQLKKSFEDEYERRYKIVQSSAPIEVVTWRIVAYGPAVAEPNLDQAVPASDATGTRRRVHVWEDDQDVLVLPRGALSAHQALHGPVILEERETTLVIPPGWSATVGPLGCVVATADQIQSKGLASASSLKPQEALA